MNLESQLTNQQLSAKLKTLGVKQESFWYWTGPKDRIDIYQSKLGHEHACSAFSVAELGLIFPDYTSCEVHDIAYAGQGKGREYRFSDGMIPARWERKIYEMVSEADARAKFAIFSLENGLIPVSSVNARIRGEK